MLSLCDGVGRREFLRIGGLSLGGLSLARLLEMEATAGEAESLLTGKSVIFLFLHGGPSQIETFDPKMDAPVEIRSTTGEVPTVLPGVSFGGTFERLAGLADRMAVVRSYQTGGGNHDIKPIVCDDTLDANLGALAARVGGANDPATGMPTNMLLLPRAVDPKAQEGNQGFGKFTSTGSLPKAFAPFVPSGDGELKKSLALRIPRGRLDDRRSLLARLDAARRASDAAGQADGASGSEAVDKFRAQAFDTILGGVAEAFDLSREDPRTLARYDTAPLVNPDQISRKWNNWKNYIDDSQTVGKLLLMARRLCENGCRFVTVTTNFVWDMHSDNNNAGCAEGMEYVGRPLDHAVSAFLEDVEARGLSDDILLVVTGEMGRSPRLTNTGGRGHWGNSSPLMLAGGGLRMGQVIGQSTRDAGEPATAPYGISNLVATILGTQLDVGRLRIATGVPRDIVRAATADPIRELL